MNVHRADIPSRHIISESTRSEVFAEGIKTDNFPRSDHIALDADGTMLEEGMYVKLMIGVLGLVLATDMRVTACSPSRGIAIVGKNPDFDSYLKVGMTYNPYTDEARQRVVSDETIVNSIFSVMPKSRRLRRIESLVAARLHLLVPEFTETYANNIQKMLNEG